ncbi:MAG TPA: hypothetical protein VMW47_05440 [Verrucomicrobiae bacterium]|nr:hypothetical protein [Verrucomicrobiae bacterium]
MARPGPNRTRDAPTPLPASEADPHLGEVVAVGTRQIAFEDGEYAVDPKTGRVLRRLS